MSAEPADLLNEAGDNIDPFRAWAAMMRGEKPGGHGERCVAVGTLDMAVWDAAAKIANVPLYRLLAPYGPKTPVKAVRAYSGGGYYFPQDDIRRLVDEARTIRDAGYSHIKIKIGGAPLAQDLKRLEAVFEVMPSPQNVAVDAMNSYGSVEAMEAAAALAPLGLWWFEDICDPLDFATLANVAAEYDGAIAAGEALFSAAEAKLLADHGGIRSGKDILLFDPVHCYGLPGYLQIIKEFEARGWDRGAFWPHGGHLFALHVVQGLGLGGAEVNPLCFQPFGGLADGSSITDGRARAPELPGIGFEGRAATREAFAKLLRDG
jgi:L-alanine-DL-glutamate epimerase-like enolase superfamily enzyme